MTVTFRPAVREKQRLLLGLAGGTGSGKTFSALELAKGISQGARFCVIDSENGRASTYADQFDFDVTDIRAPFRPATYTEAILAADAAGYPTIVVDSASHEWYGDGGCLDWHDEIMGTDQRKNITAWIEPKKAHKRMVTQLLQMSAHVILCFRAEPKVEVGTDSQGHMKVTPKASLTGLDGWIPIAEKNLPYELTASFLLMADKPGVPRPIKLPDPLKPLVPLDRPLAAVSGLALAEWAAGGTNELVAGDNHGPRTESPTGQSPSTDSPFLPGEPPDDLPPPEFATEPQRKRLFAIARESGVDKDALKAILAEFTGQESSAKIPREKYDLIVEAVEAQKVPA